MPSPAENITRHYGGDWHGNQGSFPAPGHSKNDRGMSIKDADNGDVLINSFNGGDALAVKDECRRLGLLPERETSRRREAWTETGRYEFRAADGKVIYRTRRLEKPGEDKRFVAERPDGQGGWIGKLEDTTRVLYRLPDILAVGPAVPIYLVEGERKADKLASWGFTATAVAFGAKGWRKAYAEALTGRTVAILPDNDEPGRQFAEAARRDIEAAGGKAFIVELPGLPPKGDIMDWKGEPDELAALAAGAEVMPAPASQKSILASGISAASLMAKKFEPVRYIVPGLLAEGVTLFGGKPKIGKSWMAFDFAFPIAGGGAVFGSLPVDGGDVLYLALEDNQRRLKSRMLKRGVRQAPDRLTFFTEWPTLDDGCIEAMEEWADSVPKPTLVIVDVLKKIRGRPRANEQIYDADYRCLTGLQSFALGRGLAVLVIHHVRKMEADDPLESLSGTNGLTGAADTVMVLQPDKGTGHKILYVRGRDVEEAEKAVRFEPDTGQWKLLGNAAEIGRTDERQAILDVLRGKSNPLTTREISDFLGKNYDTVRKALTRMAMAGEIEKKGRGSYTCPMCPEVLFPPEPDNRTDRTGDVRGNTETPFNRGNVSPISFDLQDPADTLLGDAA